MISGMEVHSQNFLTDINFDCMVDREFLHMIGILGPRVRRVGRRRMEMGEKWPVPLWA